MSRLESDGRGLRILVGCAAAFFVIYGLKVSSKLVVPILVGFFLAMVSLPLLSYLQKWKVPTPLAVLATVLVEVAIIAGIGALVGGSFAGFNEAIPRYQARLNTLSDQLFNWLDGMGIELSKDLITRYLDPGIAFDMVGFALRGITGILSNVFLVLLIVIFTLFEAAGVPMKLEAAFDSSAGSSRYNRVRQEVQRYLTIKTLISLMTGLIVGIALAAMNVDFPFLWGLLAFVLNYIPNLGSILAAIPPVLLALIQFGPGRATAVALLFVGVNVGLGNFVEPFFMGKRLGLSTLVVFLSLMFWGWVWGAVGMLLSVPLTMILKILLENTPDLRWVAVLMDNRPRPAPPRKKAN